MNQRIIGERFRGTKMILKKWMETNKLFSCLLTELGNSEVRDLNNYNFIPSSVYEETIVFKIFKASTAIDFWVYSGHILDEED